VQQTISHLYQTTALFHRCTPSFAHNDFIHDSQSHVIRTITLVVATTIKVLAVPDPLMTNVIFKPNRRAHKHGLMHGHNTNIHTPTRIRALRIGVSDLRHVDKFRVNSVSRHAVGRSEARDRVGCQDIL
jgi:hypothetical protein